MIHNSKINLAALVQIRRCTDSCGFRAQGCGRTRSQEATKRGGASYDPRGVCNLGGHPRTHSSPNARRSTELAKIGPPAIPHQAKKFPGGCRAGPLAVGLVPDDRLPRLAHNGNTVQRFRHGLSLLAMLSTERRCLSKCGWPSMRSNCFWRHARH